MTPATPTPGSSVPRVVLDTNALMMPVECDVRLFDELDRLLGSYEAVVPAAVREELAALAEVGGGGGGRAATAASVGADLVARCSVVEHDAEYADDAVLEVAQDCEYAVTNDRPLRERLLTRGVPVISLRGRTKLEVTQP